MGSKKLEEKDLYIANSIFLLYSVYLHPPK